MKTLIVNSRLNTAKEEISESRIQTSGYLNKAKIVKRWKI